MVTPIRRAAFRADGAEKYQNEARPCIRSLSGQDWLYGTVRDNALTGRKAQAFD